MYRTQQFFCDFLNMRVVKTIALPDGGQHFFFEVDGAKPLACEDELANTPMLAYFWFPTAKPRKAGVSSPDMAELIRTGKKPLFAAKVQSSFADIVYFDDLFIVHESFRQRPQQCDWSHEPPCVPSRRPQHVASRESAIKTCSRNWYVLWSK